MTVCYYVIVKVSKEENGVRYVAVAPDYRGLTGGGNTRRTAKRTLKEALEMLLEVEVRLKRL